MRALAALALLLPLFAAPPAAAAPSSLETQRRDLLRRTQALKAELLAQAVTAPQPALADFEARLLRIEEELRRLTGRIEELEYGQRRLERRLEELAAGRSGTAAAPASEEAGARGPAPSPAAPPVPATATVEESEPAAVPGRLAAPGAAPEVPAGAAESGAARLEEALRGAPEERYRAALDLLEAGDFDAAEEAFARFLADFPDHPLAPKATYWLGETYFYRRQYASAAQTFARGYRRYGPEAPRAPDMLLKLGMALAAVGDRDRACETFDRLAERHPRAPAPVRQALRRERAAAGCP